RALRRPAVSARGGDRVGARRLFLRRLGRVPQRVHLGKRRLARRFALRSQRAFDGREAPLEFLVRPTQHRFRIGGKMPRQIDHGEQQIAGFAGSRRGILRADIGFDFVGLLANLRQYRHRIVPVETDLAGHLLQFQRTGEGGQTDRYAGERALSGRFAAAGLFLRLDIVPEAADVLGADAAAIAEHVRMPPHKLFRDCLHHVAEAEAALFLSQARVVHDLQQQVAEFLAQVLEIAALNRIGNLVGLLDGVARNAAEVLLQIPGAAGFRRPQRGHDLDEAGNIAGRRHDRDPDAVRGPYQTATVAAKGLMPALFRPPARFVEEPDAPLGLVDPDLEQARGGGILVLAQSSCASRIALATALLSFMSSRSISTGSTKSSLLSRMLWCLAMSPIERSVSPPILRTRSASSSVVPKICSACSSRSRW